MSNTNENRKVKTEEVLMITRGRIALLMATALLSASLAHAEPRPKRWYKDWKWWVGEALIAGIRAADAHSTVTTPSRCPGCIETNLFLGKHPSTGAIVAISTEGFALESALHILTSRMLRKLQAAGVRMLDMCQRAGTNLEDCRPCMDFERRKLR